MTRPRVCILLATAILGGPGKGLVQFLRNGAREHCEPVVVGYDFGEPGETEFTLAVRETGATLHTLRQNRVYDLSLVPQALDVVRREQCEILQSHGYKSHALCALLHHITGLPWIAFVHGWTSENWKMRVYRALEQALLPLASRVVVVSEALGRSVWPPARRRMVVIPNAVDPAEMRQQGERDVRAAHGIAPGAIVAGVMGRLSPEKGQVHFLRALALARRTHPDLVGLLAGDGPSAVSLRQESERLGLGGDVVFAGHVTDPANVYRAMDIAVLPSLSEGMPNAALEAMLHGLPVAASEVGGVPEVVLDGETGILTRPGDEAALAEAMGRLCAAPDLRKSMGALGRARVLEDFAPHRRVTRMLELYHELLEAPQKERRHHAKLG